MPPLISAAELATWLNSPNTASQWVVLDCRFNLTNPQAGAQAYGQGHLPGAHYAHLDHDLSGAQTGLNGRHPLPDIAAFSATLQKWGVGPDTRVVAYDDANGMFAARLWWMLRWLGHKAVQVLDGGWPAWKALGDSVGTISTHTTVAATPGRFQAQANAAVLVTLDEVLAHLNQPAQQLLIDARAPDRFRGENETLDPVGGHIPGARNRHFQLNLLADGRFKPAHQLRQEFLALIGNQPLNTVVHQCGSGVTACHNLLAMAHAELGETRLFAGSWSAWCTDPQRPIVRDLYIKF